MMPNIDWTLNLPTLITLTITAGSIGFKVYRFLNRVEYKIDTMWIQFLLDHPDYERREGMRGLR